MGRVPCEMRPWLDQRISQLPGKSKAGLARALSNSAGRTVAPARVHEIINGTRGIDATEVETIARYLEWTVNQLLEAIRSNRMPVERFVVPVMGAITTSGNVRLGEHLVTGGEPPFIEGPPMVVPEDSPLAALAVDTDELEPRYTRGEYLFFANPGAEDWQRYLGVECVVKRSDGTLAIRVIQRNPNGTPLLVVPFRNLVEADATLEWVSPVLHVTRIITHSKI